MNALQVARAKHSILGAFVADAATMGFHWLYSQERIIEVAPEYPEFHEPSESDYEGPAGYFAHGHKRAGEFSHYGEQAHVMLTAMASHHGSYDRHAYQEGFRTHFGYGGAFVGYIDRPTRQTLDTIYRGEADALAAAEAIPFTGDAKHRQGILTKVLAAAKRYQGESLVNEAERIAGQGPYREENLKFALAVVDALDTMDSYPGAIDEQLPAVSKLPALLARHQDDADLMEKVDSAVRVTNNTERALDYAHVCAGLLRASLRGEKMDSALKAGISQASDATRMLLKDVLSRNGSVSEVTAEFGLHCDLGSGVPSLLFSLQSADSFTTAVRANLYAGGDNCGRSIVLGAAAGASFGIGGESGIPQAWIDRLAKKDQVLREIDLLFA